MTLNYHEEVRAANNNTYIQEDIHITIQDNKIIFEDILLDLMVEELKQQGLNIDEVAGTLTTPVHPEITYHYTDMFQVEIKLDMIDTTFNNLISVIREKWEVTAFNILLLLDEYNIE